ncbi:MAG: hypothetical protein ACE5ES_06055 [Candidatus Nanoarchaeia archaeon]
MARKKTKKEDKEKKPKKAVKTKKAQSKSKKKSKEKEVPSDDSGLVVIEDDLSVDKTLELEERKAYLEEARSQEASD